MPTVTEEDGTGLAGANSYVDPAGAFAVAYFAAHLHASSWSAASTGNKESAVIQATRMIDANYAWAGWRKSTTQALGWPRYGVKIDEVSQDDLVPILLKQATLEQAMALINGDRSGSTVTTTASAVSKIGLGKGALEIEMGASSGGTQNWNIGFLTDYAKKLLSVLGDPNDSRAGPSMARCYRA